MFACLEPRGDKVLGSAAGMPDRRRDRRRDRRHDRRRDRRRDRLQG